MNMKFIALAAGVLLITGGTSLLFLNEKQAALKNAGYIIWGAGLILANLNKENKRLTSAGNVLSIIGPLVLLIGFALRYF